MDQDYSRLIQMGATAAAVLGFAAWQLWSMKRQPGASRARAAPETEDRRG